MSLRGWRALVLYGLLALGLLFLYLPIISMIVFSFNASRLVTVWDAAHSPTLYWYRELLHNQQILQAARLSLGIGVTNATAAVVLGTLAAFALQRLARFPGRTLLIAMTSAPLVMPEIITGLSLLLLFIALQQLLGWPARRDATTITLAHISFSVCYVTIVVQSRLIGFDRSLEEAALDLGARPLQVFARITLPLIAPALISGWLLAFTLSWDDVVISQFVAGPGSSTLPMVIFSKVRLGVSPDVNALATVLITLVAAGVLGSTLWLRRRDRRHALQSHLAQAEE